MITSSAFRKPQRRLKPRSQRRQNDDGDSDSDEAAEDNSNGCSSGTRRNFGDADDGDAGEASLEALRIAQFKEKKNHNKGGKGSSSSSRFSASSLSLGLTRKKANPVLSFEDHYGEEDDGAVFQVKKSSQSRRLMKQKKADKKRKPQRGNDDDGIENSEEDDDAKLPPLPPPPQLQQHSKANVIEPEMNIKFKDTLPVRKEEVKERSWTLSGKEAEALHFEEEDLDEEEEGDKNRASEPLGDILRTGLIPDAAAIHAARKRRQAAREFSEKNPSGPLPPPSNSAEYISLSDRPGPRPGKGKGTGERSRLIRDEDDADDSDEDRISFTGVKSAAKDRQLRQQELMGVEHSEDEREDDWEEMQIRKAVRNSGSDGLWALQQQQQQLQPQQTMLSIGRGQNGSESIGMMRKPAAYNLQGIKGRLKERLESQTEVFRRHQSDADRAVDELISSQSEIERLEAAIPDLADRHRFYQELRGYVTDLVECFNEKIVNISYLEDKFNKSKATITDKLMERRREDVRDQMIELSSKPAPNLSTLPPQLSAQQEQQEAVAEAARQRRVAEREGRRRRRLQQRLTSQRQLKANHNDGLSSDDELSTLEQANMSKTRQEIENQARQILSDVVEEFSTIDGVKERMQEWKLEDPDSYNDAYTSLCLPKIFSPLVRLQLLFWNPFAEHNDVDQMEWYKSLSTFAYAPSESVESIRKDPDRNLITLVIEKVVMPKLTAIIKATYDPLSTTQTLRVTSLVKKLVSEYHTLRGDSKQVWDLVSSVKDRLKACIDNDPYIPIGYSKQVGENPTGGHANFVNRQFWSCFKLLRNTLAWHGILGDGILADLAITSLLNRYVLIGLGMNPDPTDAINKSKHVVAALPSEWREQGICKPELQRFSQYLAMVGLKAVGVGREGILDVVNLLKYIGYIEESETVKRLRLQ